jgi:subtilisin family serine protease
MWLRAKKEVTASDPEDPKLTPEQMAKLKARYTEMMADDSIVRAAMKNESYTGKDLKNFQSSDLLVTKAKKNIVGFFEANGMLDVKASDFLGEFGDYVESQEKKLESEGKAPVNYRDDVVKDNYKDFNDKFYGNGNVQVSNKSALHGTHVSGIIAASRNNGVGMDGIADNVKIMMLRAVPDGDEHDKDIALAIRYAVDNGAQVINMSFGKGFSPEKYWVDDAVKYAEAKGVLLVHAAGNDAKNVDTTFNYPSPSFVKDGKRASNWITVGASGPNNEKPNSLTAGFSNYGKKEVDVFAPGVKIYATVPGGNTYRDLQGTSMASPVVAGVAALILQYFPNLSAQQVKMVIEKTSQKPDFKVKNPETQDAVSLGELSKYGGVVNAFEAVKLASTLKGERKVTKPAKSTVKPKVQG